MLLMLASSHQIEHIRNRASEFITNLIEPISINFVLRILSSSRKMVYYHRVLSQWLIYMKIDPFSGKLL